MNQAEQIGVAAAKERERERAIIDEREKKKKRVRADALLKFDVLSTKYIITCKVLYIHIIGDRYEGDDHEQHEVYICIPYIHIILYHIVP